MRFLLFLAAAAFPYVLLGDSPLPVELPVILEPESEDRFFQEFMNMLTTLGLIVAAILFISWFLKKMVNSRIQQANTTSVIKIVEQRALSPKSSVYLIEIHGKQMVIGETVNGLTKLDEWAEESS